MRRILVLVLAVCFSLTVAPSAQAFLFGKKDKAQSSEAPQAVQAAQSAPAPKAESAQKPAAPAPKMDKATLESLNAKRLLSDKKKAALNNTEWELSMTPMSGKGNKEEDTLVFANNQISFPGYAKRGFPKTNYTLTVQDNGSVVWETMQTSEKSGTTFWRGELDAEMQTMRGVLSHQQADGASKDFSFASTSKKAIAAPEEKEKK